MLEKAVTWPAAFHSGFNDASISCISVICDRIGEVLVVCSSLEYSSWLYYVVFL